MTVSDQPSPDNIDIATVFRALRQSLRSILAFSVLVGVIAFGVFSLIKPVYTSEAQVEILARWEANPFADPKKEAGGDSVSVRMDREAINTHVRALQAPDLAQRIIDELKLAGRPEFDGAVGGGLLAKLRGLAGGSSRSGSAQERALANFQKRLEVFPAKDSRAIAIRFSSIDRDLAAAAANLIAERYRDSLASRTLTESSDVQKALGPRIDALKAETAAAEAAVENFRAQANIFRGGAQGGLNEQQLTELTAAESKARTEVGEAEARAQAGREMKRRGTAEGLPDVQRSPNMQKLVQDRARIEADIAKAKATMKEGHPIVKQMRSEQKAVDLQLRQEIARIVESLDKEVKVAKLRLESVRGQLNEVKSRVASTSSDQARLSELEANVRAKRSELDRLQAQFEANRARVDRRVVPVAARVIATARPATTPAFPKPMPYALLAALAAFLLGTSIALIRALASGARRKPDASVAVAPAIKARKPTRQEALAVATAVNGEGTEEAGPAFAEAVQAISVLSGDRAVRTLVSGVNDSVNPSERAWQIAEALSEDGSHVLVIDLSVDASGLTGRAGIAFTPGAAELINGVASFGDVIRATGRSPVQLMPAGGDISGAIARCDTDRLNLLLDVLDEAYTHVVVVGRYAIARSLFEATDGRFDAGVVVDTARRLVSDGGETFLGFDTSGLRVVHVPLGDVAPGAAARRGRSAAKPRQAA